MEQLDRLDARSDEPLRFDHGGRGWTVVHPRSLSWEAVAALASDATSFIDLCPDSMTMRQAEGLWDRWRTRHDLELSEPEVKSLLWRLSKFPRETELDIPDSGALFRERRWGTLLFRMDRLPRTSALVTALLDDDEYAQQVYEAIQARRAEQPQSASAKGLTMPASETTSQVQLLMDVSNQVRQLTNVVQQLAGGSPSRPKLWEQTRTKIDELLSKPQKPAHHDRLVRALLGDRADG